MLPRSGLMIVPGISPVLKAIGIVSRIRKTGGNSSRFVVGAGGSLSPVASAATNRPDGYTDLHDDKLVATSRKLIAHALTLRDKDGVFIENGGRDSSYNVVSILFGQVLALHVALPEFEAALPAAVAWELTRIRDTGKVDVTGNTRTGVGKEKSYTGQPKNVNYNEVVLALTFYGLAHDDKAARAAADRVFAYTQRPQPAAK